MENRLLYSPKEVREKRLQLLALRNQTQDSEPQVISLNQSLINPGFSKK